MSSDAKMEYLMRVIEEEPEYKYSGDLNISNKKFEYVVNFHSGDHSFDYVRGNLDAFDTEIIEVSVRDENGKALSLDKRVQELIVANVCLAKSQLVLDGRKGGQFRVRDQEDFMSRILRAPMQ